MSAVQHGGHTSISTLLPYGGWLLALALLIWIAQHFFRSFFEELGARFATFFLGFFGGRALRKHALKRYQRALIKNYSEHALGFRSQGTVKVKEVYVPLQYDDQGRRRDVFEAINAAHRSVVVGEPGAGKSLLLKHILVTWADGSARERHKVPILVELHRCNAIDSSLTGLIRDELERNGIRGVRDSVVERALADGRIFVLFDGLDEVTRENQPRVANLIRDFATKWEDCKCLTTCRIAVYTGQLSPQFSSTAEIMEFDDAGIRRLLASWPTLDATEADRFFAGLAESPQLMRLAGSPLLLTMMVYLHSEIFAKSGRTLPSSRSAFYEIAVDHLLRRDRELARDDALSIYEGADKRAALQRVALFLQRTPADQLDRRAIERIQLMETVKEVATNLNLRDKDVAPLIKEIIDRSQLLVELDGQSSRYIFRHLTLQEFLAASELRNNPTLLMQAYHSDPDGWREVIRLWCGSTSLDSTAIVKEIFKGSSREKILALQCVAEATNINLGFAEEVVAHFIDQISSEAPDHAIESALGAVASDDRPRGQAVLACLRELFLSDGPGHASAARALAATRRPAAAQTLGERILGDDTARGALRTMGEQAIPVLRAAAANGDLSSVDDLGEIATASAAAALITLMADEGDVAFLAAWWVAALVRHPEVLEGLRIARPTLPTNVQLFQWVWEPFSDSILAQAMGRVAWLLAHDTAGHCPATLSVIDHRLGIAVFVFGDTDGPTPMPFWPQNPGQSRQMIYDAQMAVIRMMEPESPIRNPATYNLAEFLVSVNQKNPSIVASGIAAFLTQLNIPEQKRHLFNRLPAAVQFLMVGRFDRLVSGPLTIRQWIELTVKIRQLAWLETVLLISLGVLALLTLIGDGYRAFGSWWGFAVGGPWWLNISARYALGVLLGTVLVFFFAEYRGTKPLPRKILYSEKVRKSSNAILNFSPSGTLPLVAFLVCLAATLSTLKAHTGWDTTSIAIASVIVYFVALSLVIGRHDRRIRNPFRMYLTQDLNTMELDLLRSQSMVFGGRGPASLSENAGALRQLPRQE